MFLFVVVLFFAVPWMKPGTLCVLYKEIIQWRRDPQEGAGTNLGSIER